MTLPYHKQKLLKDLDMIEEKLKANNWRYSTEDKEVIYFDDALSICQEAVDEAKHPNKFKIGETVKISIASKYYEHVDKNAKFKIVEIKLNKKNEIEYTLNEIGDSRTGYTDEWLDIDLESPELKEKL